MPGAAVFLMLIYSNYRLRERIGLLEHSLRRAQQPSIHGSRGTRSRRDYSDDQVM